MAERKSDRKDKERQWYLQTLAHFGIDAMDCSFEQLKDCAKHLLASKPTETVARWHDTIVQRLVREDQSVIDLGCGDGELLARLSVANNCWVQGIESDEGKVYRCIERGVPVCHGDLQEVMHLIPDKSYDWAILENTLQTLWQPLAVMEDMLRISRRCIVSFPNFAHWGMRFTFGIGGRMPVTRSFPYTWYDTPNIHLCSITDFMDWVTEAKVRVLNAWVLVEGKVVSFKPNSDHNITGEQALFVFER
ncbi:MAG: methionine biosynthesis protein MetW [Victivallales bacterium]|nr:methionine biosynthesis protein MetW [Victivallales bacterium]